MRIHLYTRSELLSYLQDCIGYDAMDLSHRPTSELLDLVNDRLELEKFRTPTLA